MKALVTGGYFDDRGGGVVWEIDLAAERAQIAVRWEAPAHLHVPGKGFAGGSLGSDGALYVAAHAAVVRIDVEAGRVSGVLHQPCMNDLHHVEVHGDRLYVANTGLGAVDVLDLDGRFLGSHAMLPGWVNARRIGGEDPGNWDETLNAGWSGAPPPAWPVAAADDGYHASDRTNAPFHRLKVRDHLHVNHVTFDGDRMLATCFGDGTLRDLGRLDVVFSRAASFLHDGLLHGDALWLTAIDGTLLELDRSTLTVRRSLDAFQTGHHGWCRGLAAAEDYLLVGLTEVRAGRLPRHRWADREPEGSETSVLLLDRADGRLLARVDLTDRERHSKLYSIIPSPRAPE